MAIYFCIDFKAFYASVECVDRNLSPLTTPLIVADTRRGPASVVLAISHKLKEKGLKGRPRLKDIDPQNNYIIARPRMKRYIEVSANIYSLYLQYFAAEDIHIYSIDEAFIDITSYLNIYQLTATQLATKILKLILDKYNIPACCGIGTNLFLAKIALDLKAKKCKDNIAFLDEATFIKEYSFHQNLTDFWHIGRGTVNRLNSKGLYTLNDIAKADDKILKKLFGVNYIILKDHALGIEPTTIADIKNYKNKNKSLNKGQTLTAAYPKDKALIILKEIVEELVLELNKINHSCGLLGLSIKYKNETFASSFKINRTSSLTAIKKLFVNFFNENIQDYGIYKIFITVGDLIPKNYTNLSFFTFEDEKEEMLLKTINDIKERYGQGAIMKMTSLQKTATRKRTSKEIGGHNAE